MSRVWAALKVMQFIMRRPEVFPNDYYKLWRQAHDEAMAASPYAQEQFRKIVVSKRSRVNDNDAAARAHFRMVDPPVYDMVVSFWVDSIEQVGAFRQYVDALQAEPTRLRRLVGVVLPVRPARAHHRRRSAERLTARKTR